MQAFRGASRYCTRLRFCAGHRDAIGRRDIMAIREQQRRAWMMPDVSMQHASFMTSCNLWAASSPFDPSKPTAATTSSSHQRRRRRVFVPHKAAVALTPKARTFFQQLLSDPPRPDIIGIMLNYDQSQSGQPRMVFSFAFVTASDVTADDEGVSLELLDNGAPKPPKDAMHDGLPKLYVSHNAFLKVLGSQLDVDTERLQPILYDKEGIQLDPNA